MQTIIVKPRNAEQFREVLDFLKKKRVKKEVYKEPTKKEILKNIEKGMREVQLHLKGKIKLKEAKHLLDEI